LNQNNEDLKDVSTFLKEFDTFIVDEGQHYPESTWERLNREFKQTQGKGGPKKKAVFKSHMGENKKIG